MNQTINQENLNATLRMLDKMGRTYLEQVKSTNPKQAKKMEQLDTLFSREDFIQQFIACPDRQAAIQLFEDNGLVLTGEEVEMLLLQLKGLTKKLMDNDGALSDEDLEQIAGGASVLAWLAGVAATVAGTAVIGGVGALIGTVICPGIGTAIGGIIGTIVGGGGLGHVTANSVEAWRSN